MQPQYKSYIQQVKKNATELAKSIQNSGYRIVSGGTDNHLILVDVFSKGITGKQAEIALDKAGITVNKNTIPFDTNSPMITSGVRLGTPALTTRGMTEAEMSIIGKLIGQVLDNIDSQAIIQKVHSRVVKLSSKFPLYQQSRT